jgi:VWFA-related protein
MKRRFLVAVSSFVAVVAVTPAAQQTAQQPGLTFRATANFVEIDAIVTDKAGNPVRDLKPEDFEVREDGRLQTLSVCTFIDIPIVKPDPPLFRERIIEPDVVSNEKPFDGRVFMVVLDAYHISALQSAAVRLQAEKFIDRYMGENDLATVVHIGNPNAGQEFTGNKRLLKQAIGRLDGRALPSIAATINADALARSGEQVPGVYVPPPAKDTHAYVREFMAKESLESLRRLSESMAAIGGRRKALLLFSEGIGIDMMPGVTIAEFGQGLATQPNTTELRATQRAMVAAAARGNVSIYSIDPRGLRTGMEEATLIGMTPAAVVDPTLEHRDFVNQRIAVDTQHELERMKDSLREYAEQTGGLAMVDKNDMDDAFDRIVRDNSSYYVLGYQSPDQRHDGGYHRISVTTKRPDLQVRTRQGYFAPSPTKARSDKTTDPIVTALRTPAPVGGLGMRASASVMKGRLIKSTVHLTVEFSGRDVVVRPLGQVLTNDITVEYAAIDVKGVMQANGRDDVHLQLERKFHATYPQKGVRYMSEFELAPGRYQLRVAARDAIGSRVGSVFFDLDVPDVANLPFSMSDVFLTSSTAGETATGKGSAAFGMLLPAPPVMTRTFTANETLTALAAFYDTAFDKAHNVDLSVTVKSDAGAQVYQHEETKDGTELNPATGGYRWTTTVPLKGLAPGRYVLTLTGRSRLGVTDGVSKDIEFRIQ